jgi:hypothetical protein
MSNDKLKLKMSISGNKNLKIFFKKTFYKMPFVSEAQRKKCYVIQRQMNEKGLVSNWDCKEFGKDEVKKSPRIKRRVKSEPKKMGKKEGEQVYEGSRGGKYVIRKNKKVYIK